MHFWCYLVLIFLHRDAVAAARRSVSSSSEMRRWTATGTIFLQHAVTEGKAFGFGCALSTVSFYRKYDGKDSFTSIFHIRTSPLQMMTSIWRQILVLHHQLLRICVYPRAQPAHHVPAPCLCGEGDYIISCAWADGRSLQRTFM